MLTSAQIRQGFLDFFREKLHTIVPSSSLMPDSPNLLFTNAGMNQFVPIFLGERKADVSKWAGVIPSSDTRAADTQKCIRAGGKHNDLDDVGLDTYHHTFFEMLGNWSFGDYFKKEAIEWAWELVVGRWKFPPQRLYATIYQPDKGDPAERDEEAWGFWAEKFRSAGLDPAIHIVNGNKKDNFWMMGETGPCGPCSELHVDLTPYGDTKGALVNKGTAECIEIWNLVFIQFNANPDGTFSPLPAKHVDTGMGFERVTSIIQGTRGFSEFGNARISNYETDIFRPIFDELEKMSGKRYASTLPQPDSAGRLVPVTEQEKVDVAFRVIADHIRTLSFAIADGIQPGNNDRNYVLRRILRRAVRYGRTLGFKEPFFHRLVEILARTMGDVFPEVRAKQKHVEEVLKREEEAFNKTLDKGIALFEAEVARIAGVSASKISDAHSASGSARASRAASGAAPDASNVEQRAATYSRRNLPHFERRWAKYMITFSTHNRRALSLAERDIVLETILHDHGKTFHLFAACVMPDHVHILIEPWVKERDEREQPVFYTLAEILQTLKSVSAHRINKDANTKGQIVWEKESFDRMIRGDSDLEEKFLYICNNPRGENIVGPAENYRWLWTPDQQTSDVSGGAPETARGARALPDALRASESPQSNVISGTFAFRLYDEQGFPLDLTELMARERGLTVDVAGFNELMEQQKARARAAQKKTVIELSEVEVKEPTSFIGFDKLATPAKVLDVVTIKDRTAVILDTTPCYAEMGGQVGDMGEIIHGADVWRIANTQKAGNTWLHFIEGGDAPAAGAEVTVSVDTLRRAAIQRHHTVTHIMHWALHMVVSKEATQKGSFVGPDKLTFDFNSAALTPKQLADIEKLVNASIIDNDHVWWTELPYSDVRGREDVMQFFGDKYGETVRLVQVSGYAGHFDGYSMELCGGTHVRSTGEIGLFRIVSESAIAAGVRRIEAIAGTPAYDFTANESRRLHAVAEKLGAPFGEIEKKLEAFLAHEKELQKSLKAAQQREAAGRAKELLGQVETINGTPAIVADLGPVDGDALQAVADALKGTFKGVILLGGTANAAVALVAAVSPEFTAKAQAGKIIQTIAPIVGGKGGGRPDNARGGGKDATKLAEALAKAKSLL
jgi:alanyl-tRNA synthetase/REP element-mobilizing transposase RayT